MGLSPAAAQAAALAKYLQQKPLSAIYASPMKRVQQTLVPVLVNGAPKPVILPDLREVDFGDWTGLGWDEVQAKFGLSAFTWLEQLECDSIANAECGEDLRDRVEPACGKSWPIIPGSRSAFFATAASSGCCWASAPVAAVAVGGI